VLAGLGYAIGIVAVWLTAAVPESRRVSPGIVNHMANSALLDRTFVACSHPIRRGILERLAGGEMTVGEATGDFGVSKPAISKHLKLLEEAGAITRVIDGRTHRLRLREQPLHEAYAWMTNQRELWERKLDTVDQYLREQRERQQPRQGAPQQENNPAKESR
jgi:DNA-binding transcriptional ArsR family regulator